MMMFQMVAKMETGKKAGESAKIIRSRIMMIGKGHGRRPVFDHMMMRTIGAEIKQLQRRK